MKKRVYQNTVQFNGYTVAVTAKRGKLLWDAFYTVSKGEEVLAYYHKQASKNRNTAIVCAVSQAQIACRRMQIDAPSNLNDLLLGVSR